MADISGLSYDENGNPMGIPGPEISPEDLQAKADAFDASLRDPRQYAADNFGAAQPTKEQQYEAARAVQKEQQKGRHRK
jgi:hypothetical protein